MKLSLRRPGVLVSYAALAHAAASLAACGSDVVKNADYGAPVDAGGFDPRSGGSAGQYGSGGGSPGYDAGRSTCSDDLKRCGEVFTYPFDGETSVELRGDYGDGKWSHGDPMTRAGNQWTVTAQVPWNKPVQFKFFVDGADWKTDPAQPTVTDTSGDTNNQKQPTTCPDSYVCIEPPPPPPGVYDWRDAVMYFVFVDRFADGNPQNNCNVSGTMSTPYTSTNYVGGDWAGVTQKIDDGYFTSLGVNTLWITVPIQGADDVGEPGVNGDTHMYSDYHGYWPTDPNKVEKCFGSEADLEALVAAAHAKNLKVLFDYAMVHVHTESPIYAQHKNDGWFTPDCICGAPGCGNFDTKCWFTDYLAHYDYANQAARDFSVGAAVGLVTNTGVDAFRLDAIKQVDPSWMSELRVQIGSQVLAKESPPQRFYMVGETYDFQNRGLIKSLIDETSMLDGQFDFPLRIRLVEALLMRSTQNMLTPDDTSWSRTAPPGLQGLAQFMDSNDGFYGSDAVMSTFVGNHDLPRSIHYAEDTPFWSDSATDGKANAWTNEPQLSTNPRAYERLANAFAVMFTNRGVPLVYYGDEIGLPGAGDPDNRRPMTFTGWTADQQALHDRIHTLATIRAAHPALRRGQRTTLFVDADLWVYVQATSGDTVYVGINRSDVDRTSTAVPSGLPELVANAGASSGTVTIPARQARIWAAAAPVADAGGGG